MGPFFQGAASLACATEWLESDTCIVSYSDIFYESSAVELLMNAQSDLAITYDPNWLEQWSGRFDDPLDDAETFRLDENGTLFETGGKPNSNDDMNGQFMGLLKFNPEGWRVFRQLFDREHNNQIHITAALQLILLDKHLDLATLPCHDNWREVDSASDLEFSSNLKWRK